MRVDNRPGEVLPPTVPIIGRSWVRRGVSYWLRRLWVAVLMTIVFAVSATITVSLVVVIVRSVPAVVGGTVIVVVSAVVIDSFRRGWRVFVTRTPVKAVSGRRHLAGGASGLGLGLLSLLGVVVANAALVLSAPFMVGWAAAWLLSYLGKFFPGERAARAVWFGQHGPIDER